MGTLVSSLFSGGIQGVVDTAKGIIEEFHMSPEQKAEQLQKLAAAQQAAIDSARDYEVKLNDIAGQNIRADAASQDKFTERARPLFMYIIEAIIAWNYTGLRIVKIWVKDVGPAVLPADLLTLFGVCVTGYVFARSADKALALPGATNVSVLGGAIRGSNDSKDK
jgi:hypothetical protein